MNFNWFKNKANKCSHDGPCTPGLYINQEHINYLFAKKLKITPDEFFDFNCNLETHNKERVDFYRKVENASLDEMWKLAENDEEKKKVLDLREMFNRKYK